MQERFQLQEQGLVSGLHIKQEQNPDADYVSVELRSDRVAQAFVKFI